MLISANPVATCALFTTSAHLASMTVQHDWIPSVDTFSERLVLVRHRMGWNLKEAALACGISPQSWREWELEHREPRRYQEACARIADRTGCNRVWLMTGIALPSDDGGGTSQPVDLFELAA